MNCRHEWKARVLEQARKTGASPLAPHAGLGGDLRFAFRQLRRAPSFAAIAIATLGFGAGAATAIFTVVDDDE